MSARSARREPLPIELDPRPCLLCGLTVNRHEMIDEGEGPEFFCADLPPEHLTLLELERHAELLRQENIAALLEQWERADPRDSWKHTGKPRPPSEIRNGPMKAAPQAGPEPYRPAASTVDAFKLVASAGDVGRLKAWLADRPKDAPLLLAMLESPASC